MERLGGESEEISNSVESEEGSNNSPENTQRKTSGLSSVVSEIMSRMREDPETMETEVERIVGGFIDRKLTLERQRDPCTKNRNSANKVCPSVTRGLRLRFMGEFSPSVLTGTDIKGKDGNSIRVSLVDCLTGEAVDSGPLASAKVEIVVLEKGSNGRNHWTTKEREGDKALLAGDVYCTLTNGIGVLDHIKFRHTKRWMKKNEFRLGARIIDDVPGFLVEEATTESFVVEDKRNKLYQKSYPPSLSHEVWRLEGIGKDGVFHKRLLEKGIDTVKDFFILLNTNPQSLAQILKVSTSSKMWEVAACHARTCLLDEGAYLFYPPTYQGRIAVVFDVVGQLKGLLMENQFVPSDELSMRQKADAQKSVVSAFQQWGEVVPFDDVTSLIAAFQHLPYRPVGSDFETSDTIGLYGSTPQDTSLTCNISLEDTSRTGDFDLLATGNLDCISSQHFCPQSTAVYSGVGEAALATLDTYYAPSSFFGNNEESDHGNLYGTHSPFQDDMAWEFENFGASFHDIVPSPDLSRELENFVASSHDNLHNSNNSYPTYDQHLSSVGPVSSSLTCETEAMFKGFFVEEQSQDSGSHSCLLPGNTISELKEDPSASSCSARMRKRNFNRKNAQRRWKILFSIMRWFSVKRDVTGRTSACKDRAALSRGHFNSDHKFKNATLGSQSILDSTVSDIFLTRSAAVAMNKVQRRYVSKREKAQARWRMLFSVMRWFSVKRNVGINTRVRDMLKDLSVSSQGVAPSPYSTGDTDRRYEHNLSFPAGFNHEMAPFLVQPQSSEMEVPGSPYNNSDHIPLLNCSALGLNKSNRRYLAKRNKAQRRWRMLFSVVRWFAVRRNVNEKGRLQLMGCT